jgi:hydrogenase nickel incorporation protein HypB
VTKRVSVEAEVTSEAAASARELSSLYGRHGLLAVNLIASPGAGKTTLLERLAGRFAGRLRLAVVEGDLETEIDAERLRRHAVPVVQVNTHSTCSLQPSVLLAALDGLDLPSVDLLVVENVGNLVCPAEVPLGEDVRIVALSVTEGEEKPLKYPMAFRTADLVVLTKTDLLPHVPFRPEAAVAAARAMNGSVEIFRTSAVTGEGIHALADRLEGLLAAKRARLGAPTA